MLKLITYDLRKPGRNYSALYEALKSITPNWWHYLDSVWIFATELSTEAIYQKIKPHIDSNDYILVVSIDEDHTGWLPQKAWDWLNNH